MARKFISPRALLARLTAEVARAQASYERYNSVVGVSDPDRLGRRFTYEWAGGRELLDLFEQTRLRTTHRSVQYANVLSYNLKPAGNDGSCRILADAEGVVWG